jgi:hypothetical protein
MEDNLAYSVLMASTIGKIALMSLSDLVPNTLVTVLLMNEIIASIICPKGHVLNRKRNLPL